MGFLEQKPAYDVLINANSGDVYDVEVVKKDGYNNWVNATKSNGAAPAGSIGQASPASRTAGYGSTTSPKSTYETPEERAKKQIYIVRQSSISNAIAMLSVGSKARPDVKEVIDIASQLESFVFGSSNDATPDTFKDLDTMDDVPY